MAQPLQPAIFFDRDGVANVSPGPGYVNRLADFRIRPGFLDCVAAAASRGWPSVLVTNQRGVSRGITPPAELDAMHAALRSALAQRGLSLLDLLVCTADDPSHPDRKPNPGMLLRAAALHHLDLSRSWMVGDREKDVETGINARVAVTVRIQTDGLGPSPDADTPSRADFLVNSPEELAPILLEKLPQWPKNKGETHE